MFSIMTPTLKAIFEFIPLIGFMLGYKFFNMQIAIMVLLFTTLASVAYLKYEKVKIPPLTIGMYIIMFIFGGLTLYTNDTYFIKIKPTIINTLLSITLLVDRWVFTKNRLIFKLIPMLKSLNTNKLNTLTFLWSGCFIICAVLNELVWRNFTEQTWVYFKVFGLTSINITFSIITAIILKKFLQEKLNV